MQVQESDLCPAEGCELRLGCGREGHEIRKGRGRRWARRVERLPGVNPTKCQEFGSDQKSIRAEVRCLCKECLSLQHDHQLSS